MTLIHVSHDLSPMSLRTSFYNTENFIIIRFHHVFSAFLSPAVFSSVHAAQLAIYATITKAFPLNLWLSR